MKEEAMFGIPSMILAGVIACIISKIAITIDRTNTFTGIRPAAESSEV